MIIKFGKQHWINTQYIESICISANNEVRVFIINSDVSYKCGTYDTYGEAVNAVAEWLEIFQQKFVTVGQNFINLLRNGVWKMTIRELYEWAVKHNAENEHLTLDVLSHYTGYATGLDEKLIVIDSDKNKKPNGVRIIV